MALICLVNLNSCDYTDDFVIRLHPQERVWNWFSLQIHFFSTSGKIKFQTSWQAKPDALGAELNMVHMGEIGLGQNWHHFKHKRVHRRSATPISDHLNWRLSDHYHILDFEQQRARKRVKRDFVESFRFRCFFNQTKVLHSWFTQN